MNLGLVVFADNRVAVLTPVLSEQRTGESFIDFIIRLAAIAFPSSVDVLVVDDSTLPSLPINNWRYIDGELVVVDPSDVDWDGLCIAFSSIPPSVKDGLDKYYSRLHQAIIDQDEEYILLLYGHMLNVADNGIAQTLIDQVVLKFGECNLTLPV